MFQTRSFTFTLSNPSLTALTYQWQIQDKAGNPDKSGKCRCWVAAIHASRSPCCLPAYKADGVVVLLLSATGVYSLSQESGTLQGGSSQQLTLRFSPVEVEDVSRVLVCHMPELEPALAAAAAAASGLQAPPGRPGSAAAATQPLRPLLREVSGKVRTAEGLVVGSGVALRLHTHLCASSCNSWRSDWKFFVQTPDDVQVLRPWCHFELPDSDYAAGGRRNPDLPGPSGVIELLDPATKVCTAHWC